MTSKGSMPILPMEKRAASIIMSASAELLALAREEQAHFPRLARLLSAIKRAAARASIELVSLGVSYPDVSAFVALIVVGWFYAASKEEAQQ